MLIPPFKPKLPEIAERDQTPLVRSLLQIIGQQQEQIQRLEDELRRLQGGPPRPQLKPNTLEPAGSSAAAADGDPPRRRGPQRAKTAELQIDATERVPLADVPDGAAFKCYRREVIDGIQPLLSAHFNLTVEMPLKAIVRGYSYKILPISWTNRTTGESKLKIKEMGSRYLFIVLYAWLERTLSRGDYRRH